MMSKTTDLLDMVPVNYRWVLQHDWLDDGDSFPIGDGRVLEYDLDLSSFRLLQRGVELGVLPRQPYEAKYARFKPEGI